MDLVNHSTTKKIIKKKEKKRKKINQEDSPIMSRMEKTNIQLPISNFQSTSASNTEDNHDLDKFILNKVDVKDVTKAISIIKGQKSPTTKYTDDSDISSEEKGSSRKDRKPLPLIFDKSHPNCTDNDSSSETSEDNKGTGSCKCVYLGERETLRSFWDKCLYQCFKSKRCVAGEKPKRKYRKKIKTSKSSIKKRKQLDLPLSCIDTRGIGVASNDYLSRYEMLLYMDPLANSLTPWQKNDFEMHFRMVKPTDIFSLAAEDKNGESTDYTNSDTD